MLEETLKERGAVYGDYRGNIQLRKEIMNLIASRHYEVTGQVMSPTQIEYIRDVVNKISRLAVTPDHIDTWHDISGYAALVENILREDSQPTLPLYEE